MRDRFLRALVLLGAAVWFITEVLSGFDAIRRAPLIVCWLLAAAAILARRSHDRKGVVSSVVKPHFDFPIAACCAGSVAILVLTAITAAFSPPNSADAMAYHMPRVVYWAEQASVRFFPTHYLNQIMLQPFAEYVMLQSYVLTGGDHFINFGQWSASAASIIAASCIAREWGAPARGQAIAALFCATIPSGILASSGAKNDYVLAMWLAAAVYFALRWRKTGRMEDAAFLGCALGLALLTKATAYLFAPWPLIAIVGRTPWSARVPLDPLFAKPNQPRPTGPQAADQGASPTVRPTTLAVTLACALAINVPQYFRNYALTGSVLGSDSAFGDQRFRWPNESFGWKSTASNALRNASEQLGARSDAWNRGVYNFVLASHRLLGISPNDPATTWRGAVFAPPRNANHEADAPNRLHLAILLALACLLAWRAIRGRDRERAIYALSLALAFLAFCAYLKWQPFMARLFLPLFVMGAPLVSAIRPLWIQAAMFIFLLDGARRPALENWVRPLKGPTSVLTTPRDVQYFSDMTQWRDDWPAYSASAAEIEKSGCGVIGDVIGIDIANFQLEYPLQALLRERNPQIKFEHTGVENASSRYRQPVDSAPCAVVCLHCIGDEHRLSLYRKFPRLVPEGRFAIFER